jgi:hypothetical protein
VAWVDRAGFVLWWGCDRPVDVCGAAVWCLVLAPGSCSAMALVSLPLSGPQSLMISQGLPAPKPGNSPEFREV